MPGFSYAAYDLQKPLGIAVSADGTRIYVTQSGGDQATLILDGQRHHARRRWRRPPTSRRARPSSTWRSTRRPATSTRPTGQPVPSTSTPPTARTRDPQRGSRSRRLAAPRHRLRQGRQPVRRGRRRHASRRSASSIANGHVVLHDRQGRAARTSRTASPSTRPATSTSPTATTAASSSSTRRAPSWAWSSAARPRASWACRAASRSTARGASTSSTRSARASRSTARWPRATRRPVYLDRFGREGTVDGAFEFPNGIAVDGRGRVYVADWNNDRIQVWSY